MIVKICGITQLEDAQVAADAGADTLGFNFYPKSKRYIEPEKAREMCETLRQLYGHECPLLVGLFVNEVVPNILAIKNSVGLDAVQLSGDEPVEVLEGLEGIAFKAIHPANVEQAVAEVETFYATMPQKEKLPSLLVDAYHPGEYGGTGLQAADEIALMVKQRVPRMMLAGGLRPENVAARIASVQPWGVDVASGVERDGIKDHTKIKAFIKAAKSGR